MANLLYPKGKQHLLAGDINLSANDIKACLVDTQEYSYSALHETIQDVPAGGIVASASLSAKDITNGVFDADDVTFSNVAGDQSEAIVLYKDSGAPGTSYLIAYLDQGASLPVTPDGSDIIIQWSNGASKIFSI